MKVNQLLEVFVNPLLDGMNELKKQTKKEYRLPTQVFFTHTAFGAIRVMVNTTKGDAGFVMGTIDKLIVRLVKQIFNDDCKVDKPFSHADTHVVCDFVLKRPSKQRAYHKPD